MVTGVAPFTADSPVSVAYKHVREDAGAAVASATPTCRPTSSRSSSPRSPRTPENRYQTADDLRADLLRFRRGRPSSAHRFRRSSSTTPRPRQRKPCAPLPGPPGAAAAAYGASTVATPRVDDRGRITGTTPIPRKRRNTALVWILTLLGLAAVVGAILFAAIKLGGSQATVTVPNEVTKKVDVAQQEIDDTHLADHRAACARPDRPCRHRRAPGPGRGQERVARVERHALRQQRHRDESDPVRHHDRPHRRRRHQRAEGAGLRRETPETRRTPRIVGNVFDSLPKPGTSQPVGSDRDDPRVVRSRAGCGAAGEGAHPRRGHAATRATTASRT